MLDAYVQLIGRMAYFWGYPLVNAHNRRAAFAEAPKPGLLAGVIPVAPVGFNQMLTDYVKPEETFIVCPNQDDAKLFFANPLNRFSLGTKNKTLQYGPDGSLTLYLGAKSPGTDHESNWLPAPAAHFSLLLRNYWPEEAILSGAWVPPNIDKASES